MGVDLVGVDLVGVDLVGVDLEVDLEAAAAAVAAAAMSTWKVRHNEVRERDRYAILFEGVNKDCLYGNLAIQLNL